MFKVKNWSKYQSYKDRKPPWIRFHRSIIDDPTFQRMSSDARAILPMLWLLACEDDDPVSGLIRMSYEDIAWRLRLDLKIIKSAIQEVQVSGFIECIESVTETLQDSNSGVSPETETETETDIWFDEFWKNYPSRSPHPNPKKPAKQKFELAIKNKKATPDEIIEGAKRYASYVKANKSEPQYVAQTVSWLNQERWAEEIQVKKGSKF